MLEDVGGEVQSVEVSGLTGKGLDELIEAVSLLAELSELRSDASVRVEGYVLESEVTKGRG